jgi:hypothetical protein
MKFKIAYDNISMVTEDNQPIRKNQTINKKSNWHCDLLACNIV